MGCWENLLLNQRIKFNGDHGWSMLDHKDGQPSSRGCEFGGMPAEKPNPTVMPRRLRCLDYWESLDAHSGEENRTSLVPSTKDRDIHVLGEDFTGLPF